MRRRSSRHLREPCRLHILELFHSLAKTCRLENRARIPTGFLELAQDVGDGGHPEHGISERLGLELRPATALAPISEVPRRNRGSITKPSLCGAAHKRGSGAKTARSQAGYALERAEPAMQFFPLFRRVIGQLLGCFDHMLQ